jgi:hypothetical protein
MTDELVVLSDLITPENLSQELLKFVFNHAYIDVYVDKDDDLYIDEEVRCYILISDNKKDRIRLLSVFGFVPESVLLERLECANRINDEFTLIRAAVTANDTLTIDYDIYIRGGITRKNFIQTVKRFCSIPRQAIREYGQDVIN